MAARHAVFVLLLAALLLFGAGGAWAATTQAADSERGRALYDGQAPLLLAQGTAGSPQGCVSCHRPSGLGNFEGGLAVPPIAGPYLFKALDRDTARFFHASARYRVRPAYDDAALGRLLRTGVAPDGVTLHATMPRFQIDATQLADLSAYLRGLSASPSPGLERDVVHLATVSTPDADPVRRDAMLATLARFVEQKNGQSRQEARRSTQAARTREMVMYTKFRVWQLEHWALHGPPGTWARQLAERQAARPVFALVAGIGRSEWGPVDTFCAAARIPCLLPLVEAGAGASTQPGFYSLHYHAGIDADVALAAKVLQRSGITSVRLWSEPGAEALTIRVAHGLQQAGLAVSPDDAEAPARAIVSLLAPPQHVERLSTRRAAAAPVLWLAGTHAIGQSELDAAVQGLTAGWIVTPMRAGAPLDRQLQRARSWLQQQGLQNLPTDVAASTLQAATVLGEGLAHLDFGFTREYLLELLEHGLENVIPWSPFPRLAIGPHQRIATRHSQLGEVRDGRIDWTAATER